MEDSTPRSGPVRGRIDSVVGGPAVPVGRGGALARYRLREATLRA